MVSMWGMMASLPAQEVVISPNYQNSVCVYDEEIDAYYCFDSSQQVYFYYYPEEDSYYYPIYPGIEGGYWYRQGRGWHDRDYRSHWGERKGGKTYASPQHTHPSTSNVGPQHITPTTPSTPQHIAPTTPSAPQHLTPQTPSSGQMHYAPSAPSGGHDGGGSHGGGHGGEGHRH